MTNALKRNIKVGQYIYVVDCWDTGEGMHACETEARVLEIDEKNDTFFAVLYGDTYNTYSLKDYGRLIFYDKNEVDEAVKNLPKPQTEVYQIMGKSVYKKKIIGIYGRHIAGTYDLLVHLNKGKDVSTKEIGQSLFFNEVDARKNKK